MKKESFIIAFIILISADIVIVWKYLDYKKDTEKVISDLKQSFDNSYPDIDLFGYRLRNNRVQTFDGKGIYLDSIISRSRYNIIGIFSGAHCTSCLSLGFPAMSALGMKNKSLSVNAIVNEEQSGLSFSFRKAYPIQGEVFIDDTAGISKKYSLAGLSLLILLDPHGRIITSHRIDYKNEEKTMQFIKKVKQFIE